MGIPTKEELKEALAEAARMRESGEDEHFVAKSLLNLCYRFKYYEKVFLYAEKYLHAGLDEFAHRDLLLAIEKVRQINEEDPEADNDVMV